MARRKTVWRTLRLPLKILAVILAIPLVMTPAYLVLPPVSVPMLARIVTGQPMDRDWRSIDDISDRLKAAVILSEDGQFCRHWGVDLAALQVEVDNYLAGRETRGASTITMQVARNLFLWNHPSAIRKALEVPLALYIDLVMPKRRIMEIYLNIAEWGPEGQFGVVAGSYYAFGREPQNLDWRTAGLLAVTLPNPHLRDPGAPNAGLSRLADLAARRGQQFGDRASCVGAGGRLAL